MANSLNVRFTGAAPPDREFDHPAGASIAKLLQNKLTNIGWKTEEFDNWRDCGWFFQCSKDAARIQIAFAQGEKDEWMLQVSPTILPGFIGKIFGKLPSATPENVLLMAKDVNNILRNDKIYSNFKWCWDGFPDDNNSTPEPKGQ